MEAVATIELNHWTAGRPTQDQARSTQSPDLAGLMQRAAAGHGDALCELYDHTRAVVYGICLRILREPADAEEVALDVYTQAWQSARHFDPARGNVTAWLAILARSRAIDRLRSRSRHDVCDGLDTAPELPARGLDPEQRTMQNAGQQRVRQALRQLPARQRQLLELAFFYGFTHSELARKLGQPLGTVKTRLRSALSSLRLALNNSCCSSVY